MRYNPEIHHRRSLRLHGYDYTQEGTYFITLCTQDHACLFGDITGEEVCLNPFGQIIKESWQWLGEQYHDIQLDSFIIMPNHLHGLLIIDHSRGGSRSVPAEKQKPLGRLVGAFKTVSAKRINQIRQTPGAPVWQRNYYEHIVRNQKEFNKIVEYILNNPIQWELDRYYPENMIV